MRYEISNIEQYLHVRLFTGAGADCKEFVPWPLKLEKNIKTTKITGIGS